MIDFYVHRIIAKKTTFLNVPTKMKNEVAKILVDNGYENLIISN